MKKKQNKDFTLKDVEKSLSQQTAVILDTVDKKLVKTRREGEKGVRGRKRGQEPFY